MIVEALGERSDLVMADGAWFSFKLAVTQNGSHCCSFLDDVSYYDQTVYSLFHEGRLPAADFLLRALPTQQCSYGLSVKYLHIDYDRHIVFISKYHPLMSIAAAFKGWVAMHIGTWNELERWSLLSRHKELEATGWCMLYNAIDCVRDYGCCNNGPSLTDLIRLEEASLTRIAERIISSEGRPLILWLHDSGELSLIYKTDIYRVSMNGEPLLLRTPACIVDTWIAFLLGEASRAQIAESIAVYDKFLHI